LIEIEVSEDMIRTLQLLVQLGFASKVFAWNHVSRVEYEASLKDNVALVACKSGYHRPHVALDFSILTNVLCSRHGM
jgi:hypothetical protein